eukprot:11875453-Karenia_brevis.AAC.1
MDPWGGTNDNLDSSRCKHEQFTTVSVDAKESVPDGQIVRLLSRLSQVEHEVAGLSAAHAA